MAMAPQTTCHLTEGGSEARWRCWARAAWLLCSLLTCLLLLLLAYLATTTSYLSGAPCILVGIDG